MNITHECPNISDTWKGGRAATAKILGIDPRTLDRYCRMPRREGGIEYVFNKRNQRKVFYGHEIKRFWKQF